MSTIHIIKTPISIPVSRQCMVPEYYNRAEIPILLMTGSRIHFTLITHMLLPMTGSRIHFTLMTHVLLTKIFSQETHFVLNVSHSPFVFTTHIHFSHTCQYNIFFKAYFWFILKYFSQQGVPSCIEVDK